VSGTERYFEDYRAVFERGAVSISEADIVEFARRSALSGGAKLNIGR
jgi:hypothetical protein